MECLQNLHKPTKNNELFHASFVKEETKRELISLSKMTFENFNREYVQLYKNKETLRVIFTIHSEAVLKSLRATVFRNH